MALYLSASFDPTAKIFKHLHEAHRFHDSPASFFSFFFLFKDIYIFICFCFIVTSDCERENFNSKWLHKKKKPTKKKNFEEKKKTQKTAFTFPLKFIVSDLIKQSTKSCLIVTLKLAESCRFSKDRQRPIRRLQSGDDAWQQFHLPPSHHCHLFLYLSTRAAPTGYLQDCLSLDAENDCHPPPLSFRHFFSPSPAKLNYDHWVLACVHICIHGYICIHFLYTHLYIYRHIHNPRVGCCASAVSFRHRSPGPPCP